MKLLHIILKHMKLKQQEHSSFSSIVDTVFNRLWNYEFKIFVYRLNN